MFDSILVRRTALMGASGPLDLGRLAESLLFYQKVHLALTRSNVEQLLRELGPATALELVEYSGVDAMFLDRDYAVRTNETATSGATHQAASITLMTADKKTGLQRAETRREAVHRLFRAAVTDTAKADKLADKFLRHVRDFHFPDHLQDAVVNDWSNETYMKMAIAEFAAAYAPDYQVPEHLRIELLDDGDGRYRFESNLDWSGLCSAYSLRDGSPIDQAFPLLHVVEMRQDLHLAATFATGVAQDLLGAKLTSAKCVDLAAALDAQSGQIKAFHTFVVGGLDDIAGAVNCGAVTFAEVLDLLKEGKGFRSWLAKENPDADLVKDYWTEVLKRRRGWRRNTKDMRWLIPAGGGTAATALTTGMTVAQAVGAGAAGAAWPIFDRFILGKIYGGWRPKLFIDNHLSPTISQPKPPFGG
jgi:hypothetical protein